ncbi:MAG: putative baseplate assembly protein [Caldilineaceae bacterium]
MPLPAPNLDDLRFQRDLVDEARRRIVQYCPEWTDYNLSDPGITLIELFAWMTETMLYRLNRVPEKNYVKFMDLLGITLQPASSARTELTFRLSVPFPVRDDTESIAVVPHHYEVATRPLENEEQIVFTTDDALTIRSPRLTQLRRGVDFARNYLARLAVEDARVFRDQFPQEGDTFYLGFDDSRPLAGYILRLQVTSIPTQATGIRRDDPPLVWECSLGDGEWYELTPSQATGERDTTGGLNNPIGQIHFYLPMHARPDDVQGISAFWLRCRFEQRRVSQGTYTRSPRVKGVEAYALGATVSATNAVLINNEELGVTTGEAGQTFRLRNAPILQPNEEEVLEIEERVFGETVFVAWSRVENFASSSRYDRHYTIDVSTGEIALGPNIRQRDGAIAQYGRIPEANRLVRFSSYRAGGGVQGNVPAGRINVLLSTLPYIDSVSNLQAADGGRDAETLDEAKLRVPHELRAQSRAVTAADFEDLTYKASRAVARVKVLTPGQGPSSPPPGMVEVLVVPECRSSLAEGDLSRLALSAAVQQEILSFLDEYRLLTTTLLVREPTYMGVRVFVEVIAEDNLNPDLVRARVLEALRAFLAPLPLAGKEDFIESVVGGRWEGWPFGRDLYLSEILALLQKVSGVRHVRDVRAESRRIVPSREPTPTDEIEISDIDRGLDAAVPIRQMLSLDGDGVLCLLEPTITIFTEQTALGLISNGAGNYTGPRDRNRPLTPINGSSR